MSEALKPLEAAPIKYGNTGAEGIRQLKLRLDHPRHHFTEPILDMVTNWIVFFSARTSRLVLVNRAAADSFGYTQQQLRRMSLLDIAPQATDANLKEIYRRVMMSTNQEARVRTVYRHQSGSLVPARCSIRALRPAAERIWVAVGQEISAGIKMDSPRVTAAFRDSLTLLPNRAWLWRQLEREVRSARQSDYRFAVLFIDVDQFKDINDCYGHLAGDQVLQAVASRLSASIRPNDVVARYGGDEFVVLMKDVAGAKVVRAIAERISRCVNATGKHQGGKGWRARVTVSIGVAISGGPGSSAVYALERADRAMYRAKRLGRGGRFVIDEIDETPTNSVRSWEFARSFPIGQDSSNELD
jgi:diguanylate cyclase (GGDEF)-like protein/PAS domain S-box-containing protein